jgi:uncharacterized membrane protein YbaN (DUF454 family)
MHKRIKKYLLFVSGLLFLASGIIGAVLPILPTTPFLILALACFANSSPRFHQMLLNNRWFGVALQQWEENRSISRTSKIKAMLMVVLTFSVSIGVLHGKLSLQLMLLTLGCVLLVFMWRLKEAEPLPARVKK